MMRNVYDKIEDVLKAAEVPLAVHEFDMVVMPGDDVLSAVGGRDYIGCTESTLGRRLREMRELGRVVCKTREGKSFKEFALPVVAVQQALL